MSIKNELTTLRREREEMEGKLAEINLTLDKLYAKREPIAQKAESLRTRTSSLAETLLEKVQKKLKEVNKEIVRVEKKQVELKEEIEKNQQNILLREDDVGLYIEEQSSIMVCVFLEYIKDHLEYLGLEIEKTFRIMEVTSDRGDRTCECHVPTGNIGIYDESEETFIVTSKDFYFEKKLFTITEDGYEMTCNKKEWYKAYHEQFVSHLLETLKKNYTYDEFFKLTIIKNSYFTLELV